MTTDLLLYKAEVYAHQLAAQELHRVREQRNCLAWIAGTLVVALIVVMWGTR